jgi:hypothetical protein
MGAMVPRMVIPFHRGKLCKQQVTSGIQKTLLAQKHGRSFAKKATGLGV